MKVTFCLFFALMLFFLHSDAVIEEGSTPIDCSGLPKQACTKEYKPHCASDGITYVNRCHFCKAQVESRGSITFSYYGECIVPKD